MSDYSKVLEKKSKSSVNLLWNSYGSGNVLREAFMENRMWPRGWRRTLEEGGEVYMNIKKVLAACSGACL